MTKYWTTRTTADFRSWACRASIAVLLIAAAVQPVYPADKKTGAEGVVAGSVFDANGRSLRGVRVLVVSEDAPKKKHHAASDGRGEFAVRVPAGAGRYVVTVQAKGFAAQSKAVEVFESEKTSVTFLLEPK